MLHLKYTSLRVELQNGTISRIESSEPDVFFALKEGLNRFSIVTAVEFLVHEQSLEVYVSGFSP